MAKKYRLEALLNIKTRDKKRAEIALAKFIKALMDAKEKLKTLEKEKEEILESQHEAKTKMDLKMRGGGMIGEGCHHVNFLRKLTEDEEAKEEEIVDQKNEIEDCTEQVAKSRKIYINAAKQLQIMEKHKELWAKKLAKEISDREEKEMDELGQTIHRLREWRGEKSVFQI